MSSNSSWIVKHWSLRLCIYNIKCCVQVSYYFPHKVLWRSFFSALTAMLVLTYMNPYFTGKLVLFYANYDGPWNIAELICFIFLGILGVSSLYL